MMFFFSSEMLACLYDVLFVSSGSGFTVFIQYFATVGWVIWPVKIIPEMTYIVSSGTLNLCLINQYFALLLEQQTG